MIKHFFFLVKLGQQNIGRRSSISPHQKLIRRTTTISARPAIISTTTSEPQPKREYLRKSIVKPKPFERTQKLKKLDANDEREFKGHTYRPISDYDYYDDGDVQIIGKSNSKVLIMYI